MKVGQATRLIRSGVESTLKPDGEVGRGWGEKTLVLDRALQEYRHLHDTGQPLEAREFVARYPQYAKTLLALIQVESDLQHFRHVIEDWPAVGDTFCGFELRRELGQGQMARVYLASEPALGDRRVVVKISDGGGAEAHILGQLSHPNIVPVLSATTDPNTALTAVCMPYLGSTTLSEVLEVLYGGNSPRSHGREVLAAVESRECLVGYCEQQRAEVPPRKTISHGSYIDAVVRLGMDIADALAYTADRRILHRDLKPSNVLITPRGRAMLLDFNLSCKSADENSSRLLGGTLPYMAPEQISEAFLGRGRSTARSDVFSLGVLLYEMLTGQLPFGHPDSHDSPQTAARVLIERQKLGAVPIEELNPSVEPALADTVHRCLVPDEAQRTSSAPLLLEELGKHFSAARRLRRTTRRYALLTLVASALLAIAAYSISSMDFERPQLESDYRSALDQLLKGQLDGAGKLLDSILARDAELTGPRMARGVLFMMRGQHQRAIDEFIQLPRTPARLECQAYAELELENYERAGGLFNAVFDESVDSRKASRYLLYEAAARHMADSPKQDFTVWQAAERARTLALGDTVTQWFRAQLYLKPRYRQRVTAIASIAEMERAITRVEKYDQRGFSLASFYFDAARIYGVAELELNTDCSKRIRELLSRAIEHGLEPSRLVSVPELKRYFEQGEFPGPPPKHIPDPRSEIARWVPPFDAAAILAQLAATPMDEVP